MENNDLQMRSFWGLNNHLVHNDIDEDLFSINARRAKCGYGPMIESNTVQSEEVITTTKEEKQMHPLVKLGLTVGSSVVFGFVFITIAIMWSLNHPSHYDINKNRHRQFQDTPKYFHKHIKESIVYNKKGNE